MSDRACVSYPIQDVPFFGGETADRQLELLFRGLYSGAVRGAQAVSRSLEMLSRAPDLNVVANLLKHAEGMLPKC